MVPMRLRPVSTCAVARRLALGFAPQLAVALGSLLELSVLEDRERLCQEYGHEVCMHMCNRWRILPVKGSKRAVASTRMRSEPLGPVTDRYSSDWKAESGRSDPIGCESRERSTAQQSARGGAGWRANAHTTVGSGVWL